MDNQKRLLRNDSICPSPDDVLLEAVKNNKLHKVQSLISENKHLLSFNYLYPYFGRILYVACTNESTSIETVQLLLDLGASPCDETEEQGEAIHVAARLMKSGVVKLLVKHLAKEELNHIFKGNNALLILIKEGDYTKERELLECARVLLEAGINVNHVDSKNLTAILWAIRKDCVSLVDALLKYSTSIDIDTYKMNGKTARELIIWKYSAQISLPNQFTNNASPKDLLFSYLKEFNEENFVNFNDGDLSVYKDADNSTLTLLQLSCQLGLYKAVKHLLVNSADIRKTTEKQPRSPLELASENGHPKIVELLLSKDPTMTVSAEVFSIVLNRMNANDSSEEEYDSCFYKLLDKQDDLTLNSETILNQTPLHLAVKFAKSKHVLDLLRKGASLATKNRLGIMPIEHIDAEVLEDHLDQCVEINDVDKNNISVTLNYKTLIPFTPRMNTFYKDICEDGKMIAPNLVPETDAILYMCKASHLRHLLTHPVIVTFLLLKWYKVRKLFFANLMFYMTFLFSLVGYIFASYANFHYISKNESFLSPIASVSLVVLFITFFLLVARECFQVLVSPRNYYKDIDNWIEVILIFNVGFILFIKDPTNDTRKQLASIAILLCAFEFVLMIGQHPRLTTNVVMFKRVSSNFIQFLAWYFQLIAAFALSFYILFSESTEEEPTTSTEANAEENEVEANFFVNPGVALFKTLVMLTGEFDASDMNFHTFPVTSKVIFILFVLMIALILLNLLNGLAVSDTQLIKSDAECVGLISRTEHVHYIESMVLGNILPTKLFRVLQNICCCFPMFNDHTIILGKPLSENIMLYPKTSITIPMSNDIELSPLQEKGSKKSRSLSVFTSLYLGREIRRKIKKVLQKQKTNSSENFLRNKIKKIESEQQNVLSILKNIEIKLEHMEMKLRSNDS